jgi:hypothetical protein
LYPRVNAVLAFFARQDPVGSLRQWAETHQRLLAAALEGVTAYYRPAAAQRVQTIKEAVRTANESWAGDGTLSQVAIRALRTTDGISSVLVGMRRPSYVRDVQEELQRHTTVRSHESEWALIGNKLKFLNGNAVEK